MIQQFSRFVHTGAGLEKTLRLIQALAQIAAVFTVGGTAVRLTTAKLQLALSKLPVSSRIPVGFKIISRHANTFLSAAILPLLWLPRVLSAGVYPTQ